MSVMLSVDHTRNKPFSDQIREQLRSRIRSGELTPGEKIPSIRVLSRQSGVSMGIVQRAIESLVSENFLRSRQGQGVFVSERQLASQTVALVLPTCEVEHMPLMIRGIKNRLCHQTANLVVMAADSDFFEEIEMIRKLDKPFISGAVIYAPPLQEVAEALDALRRRNFPFVLVDTLIEGDFDTVTTHWQQTTALAFEHILAKGHRQIGIVGKNLKHRAFELVTAGMQQALDAVGIKLADLPRVDIDAMDLQPRTPWSNGQRAATQLLKDNPQLTAVVGLGESLSLGVYRAAQELGLRVPDDLSIVSMGDLQIFQMLQPAVTAVHIPHEAMAQRAVDRLLELIQPQAGVSTVSATLWVEPELMVRQSVLQR